MFCSVKSQDSPHLLYSLKHTKRIFLLFLWLQKLSAMTSMFDQYDKTLKSDKPPSSQVVNAALTSSGYVSVRTKEETPIFSKRKMQITLPHDIMFLKVCNNWLVTLMSHNVLLRLYLPQPDRQDGNVTFGTLK